MTRADLADAVVRLGRRTDRRDIIRYDESDYYPRLPTFAVLRGPRREHGDVVVPRGGRAAQLGAGARMKAAQAALVAPE